MEAFLEALIPLISASVGAAITLLVQRNSLKGEAKKIKLSREHKQADFHRDSLEVLRNDIAKFIELSGDLHSEKEDFHKLSAQHAKVLMRISPENKRREVLSSAMIDCFNPKASPSDLAKYHSQIIDVSYDLIQENWLMIQSKLDGEASS